MAAVFAMAYTGAITALFRTRGEGGRAALMARLFLASLPIYALVNLAIPANFGLFNSLLTPPSAWIDLGFGLFLYFALFFGGILQLYNLAERGFSLRMVIDADQTPDGMTIDDVFPQYAAGKGIQWMYDKRIEGLLANGLIKVDGDIVRNTAKGARLANTFYRLRLFFRVGPGVWPRS